MSANVQPKYMACGNELRQLRLAQGIASQRELAKLLGFTQQTVSRWEAGASRPRAEQVGVIAKALRADPQRLLVVTGHAQGEVTVSFDQPLPLASLSPEGFQRFCRSLLESLYPGASVHAAGKTGHEQFGVDIEVRLETGNVHTFQCKREANFGAAKVRTAIKAHTAKASKKFIALSRVASPLARREVQKHRGWDIWDQDDLSERLRSLTKEEQRRLVDRYFPGQRFALLGEPSPGPWLTAEDFFAPFIANERAFNHQWDLIGRTKERNDLASALADRAKTVVSLIGPAGGGKSRVLRTAIDDFTTMHSSMVFMLSPTEQVTATSLGDLGLGEKLVVVDDAHDRSDRALLAHYVADKRNNARLLLVYRSYAQEVVERELSHVGLVGDCVASIPLQKPTKAHAKDLATHVLQSLGGPVHAAQLIADVAYDSPLSVVVGAWIVAKEGLHPELFGSHELFKTTVLQHYKAAIAKGVSTSAKDQDNIERILRVLALIQPVVPDDPQVIALLQSIEGVSAPDATRLTKLLIASGVLFKRGARYRLSPDLLTDSIIETAYITTSDASNGAAERIFASAIPEHKEHLLLNLGRLDWRRHEGDTSESQLLDGLWSTLTWEEDYRRAQIKAAAEAAHYQPRQALQFAERLVEAGHGTDEDVCRLIRNAAYNMRHFPHACELLWQAGRDDPRATNQHAHHPIRLLTEMAVPEPRVPIAYCEGLVGFALSLLPYEENWAGVFTPFDVLKGALATEGHFASKSSSREITLSAYGVRSDTAAPMRRRIVDALLDSLVSENKRRAYEAAKLLASATRGPIGLMNRKASDEEVADWSVEFVETLERVNTLIDEHRLPPVILTRIAASVSWHAHTRNLATRDPAQRILRHLDRDLVTRVTRVLMDGWGTSTWRHDAGRRDRNDEVQRELAAELLQACPSPKELTRYLNDRLCDIKSYGDDGLRSAHAFINRLIGESLPLAREVLDARQRAPLSPVAEFSSIALSMLIMHAPTEAYARIGALLAPGDDDLPLVARAYSMSLRDRVLTEEDRALLQRFFGSSDRSVLACAAWMFRDVAGCDNAFAIELLANANPAITKQDRHEIFIWLDDDNVVQLDSISDGQLARIFRLFATPERLDDHSVHGFLARVAKRNPRLVVELAKERLELAVANDDWSMAPISGGSRHLPTLDVLSHLDGATILRDVLDWAVAKKGDFAFARRFADLVSGVFGLQHPSCAAILDAWSSGGTSEHFKVLAAVLREAPPAFAFDERAFVTRILKAARAIGKSTYRDMRSSLYASAVTGLRSGTPGQPFPRDLLMKKQAEEILAALSRADPAYDLYDSLRRHAEDDIERSRVEGRFMDEEDADE